MCGLHCVTWDRDEVVGCCELRVALLEFVCSGGLGSGMA